MTLLKANRSELQIRVPVEISINKRHFDTEGQSSRKEKLRVTQKKKKTYPRIHAKHQSTTNENEREEEKIAACKATYSKEKPKKVHAEMP